LKKKVWIIIQHCR